MKMILRFSDRRHRRVPGATVYLRTVQDEQRPEITRVSESMDGRVNDKRRESGGGVGPPGNYSRMKTIGPAGPKVLTDASG